MKRPPTQRTDVSAETSQSAASNSDVSAGERAGLGDRSPAFRLGPGMDAVTGSPPW